MLTFAIIASAAYALRALVFVVGAMRSASPRRTAASSPRVSVIVAARDEEANIARCLDSLVAQEYPFDRYEVLVMNDGSTDGTRAIVDSFAARYPQVRCVDVVDEKSHLRGKARAVAQGIDVASGEIFATTDADCHVGPRWIAESVAYFEPKTGLVAGITLQDVRSAFTGAQALDWGFLLTMASAGFGLKRPLGCIGNNLFFRREAYEQVGTYRGFTFSITEDFALLQAIERTGAWEYKYPVSASTLVWSEPCSDLATLWKQKRRWALGGRGLGLRGYLVLISSVLMNAAIVLALGELCWPSLFLALGVRWIADLILLVPSMARLGTMGLMRFFPLYEIYALAYELAIPFGMLKRSVEWKGRTFS